jgi:hypothetical protein
MFWLCLILGSGGAVAGLDRWRAQGESMSLTVLAVPGNAGLIAWVGSLQGLTLRLATGPGGCRTADCCGPFGTFMSSVEYHRRASASLELRNDFVALRYWWRSGGSCGHSASHFSCHILCVSSIDNVAQFPTRMSALARLWWASHHQLLAEQPRLGNRMFVGATSGASVHQGCHHSCCAECHATCSAQLYENGLLLLGTPQVAWPCSGLATG